MKRCAYCNNYTNNLTKEHTVNKSLIDYLELNKAPGYANFKEKYIPDNLTTKDVCSKCNNEHLSKLDEYILSFVKEHQCLTKELLFNKDQIKINYNYDLLSKWLLKTLYNSERKNSYPYLIKKMLNYRKHILGEEKKYFKIYLEVLADIPKELVNKAGGNDKLKPFYKSSNAIFFNDKGKLNYIKCFTISNFNFFIFVAKNNSYHEIDDMVNIFINNYEKEGIHIYNLEEKNEYFTTSKRTIIDILADTYQGNKKFSEYGNEI